MLFENFITLPILLIKLIQAFLLLMKIVSATFENPFNAVTYEAV